MTERLPRRTLWIVLMSFLLLSVVGCAHTSQDKIVVMGNVGPAVCAGGTPSPYAPIVCVNDHVPSLDASPDTVHAVNDLGNGRKPTIVNWFTVSGNHLLSISFVTPGCVIRDPDCRGSHCVAVIKTNAVVGKQCKYNIRLLDVSGYHNDPIIEIDACCPSP